MASCLTSQWRLAAFEAICADGTEIVEERILERPEKLFGVEPARLVLEFFHGGCIEDD